MYVLPFVRELVGRIHISRVLPKSEKTRFCSIHFSVRLRGNLKGENSWSMVVILVYFILIAKLQRSTKIVTLYIQTMACPRGKAPRISVEIDTAICK